jgi:hypothetical protein
MSSRRSVRYCLVLCLAIIPAVTSGASAATGAASPTSPWSQTDGTAGLSRANVTESILSASNVTKATLLRSLPTPPAQGTCDVNSNVPVSPVLSGGKVYDLSSGNLNMYNARTGVLGWSDTLDTNNGYPTWLPGYLAVSQGLVVVDEMDCVSQSDPYGTLAAFSATTGKQVWPTDQQPFETDGAINELVASGQYLVTTGSAASNQQLAVYSIAAGSRLWAAETDACQNSVVVHTTVLSECQDGRSGTPEVVARKIADGAVVWRHQLNWAGPNPLVGTDQGASSQGHAYVSLQNSTVVDINPGTGAIRFSIPGATEVLAVDANDTYAACGTGKVCAFDRASGAQTWKITDPSTLAAAANGLLYLSDGKIVAETTGKLIARPWKLKAVALAIGDGRIAVDKPPSNPSKATLQLYGLAGY